MPLETDVLIIGTGIAGAAAALRLAEDKQRQILVVTRAMEATDSNSSWAQGGIVARGENDNPDLLVHDIETAGAGLTWPQAARLLAEEGPELVRRVLIEQAGVAFDSEADGGLSYTREGAHSADRILHVGDATGRAITEALVSRLRACPNVKLLTGQTAVDLITSSHHVRDPLATYAPITCLGAYVLDRKEGVVHRVLARNTILAAGGLGQIYRYTSNPEGARGDGLAMAYRAGARVVNCEYVQFHPTTLAARGASNFLISEALRGEGAQLHTPDGRRFMEEYDPEWRDLAPRDVVARAIHQEMTNHDYPHVLLDIASHMKADRIRERFPTVYARCLEAGTDITKEPIPVVPAAHYFCGGVLVNGWGQTTIDRLYAVGEVSCTGLHGANRLASTSLLEGLVWGDRAGRNVATNPEPDIIAASQVPAWWDAGEGEPDPALIARDERIIQTTMWLYVGLVRNKHRLERAERDLNHLWESINSFYYTRNLTDDLIGLRSMAQAAWIVTTAARRNRQSFGAHFREDARGTTFATLKTTQGV